jgi:hypothetical protein
LRYRFQTQSLNRYDILFYVVISLIALDVLISTVYDFSESILSQFFGIVIFILMTCFVYGIGSYYILPFTNKSNKNVIEKTKPFRWGHKLVTISQLIIAICFGLVISEILLYGFFQAILKILIISISSMLGSLILVALGYKLLSWFKINRKQSKIVLFYSLAMILSSFSIGINGILIFNGLILSESREIRPDRNVIFPILTYDKYGYLVPLLIVSLLVYISAYLCVWLGTVSLFKAQIKPNKKHRMKIWIFAFASLSSYLMAILPTLASLPANQFIFDDQLLLAFRILFKISVILSGVFFGIIFVLISDSFRRLEGKGPVSSKTISSYARFCGYGIVMLTCITVSQPYNVTYPPFGLISTSYTALASFIIALGFYSLTLSFSSDYSLRKLIDKEVKEAYLLSKLGTAQLMENLENRVVELSKKNEEYLNQETGVESTLTVDDAKQYLDLVLNEVKSLRKENKTP